MRSSIAATLLLASAATAHYTLSFPTTIGFSDDDEDKAPCGGFTPDFSKDTLTEFHVGGENIATNLLHSQATWLYRATLDESASGNWTQLFPLTQQSGLGKFCEPIVTAPASWVGKTGVLSLVADAPDGLLYQCATVTFVSGAATSQQSACTNSSGVTAAFVSDANLTPLVSGGSDSSNSSTSTSTASTSSSTSTSTSTGTSSSSSSTATGSSAAAGRVGGSVAAAVLALAASAYMLL